jgi:S-adenosylmethionine-diacylglycerol 3-amino-3-carboxypropyl transferase
VFDIATESKRNTVDGLNRAVHRNTISSAEGWRERLFTLAFRGLVYPQIWEDPVVDLDALAIRSTDHVVAIASGGCNVMSYLVGNPARITAVDLNHHHIALNRLKITAAQTLRNHREFETFFGNAASPSNVGCFDSVIAAALPQDARDYWTSRDRFGRRRIEAFARGFYRSGLLGRFIGMGHATARLLGVDVREILVAKCLEEQRAIFDRRFMPVFQSGVLRWLIDRPAALYGLGIPPAQYASLASDDAGGIAVVLRKRLETLACTFPLKENYFAWQAFGRGYDPAPDGSRPPYLEERNFELIRARAGRIDVRHTSYTDFLAAQPAQSADCYVLLDAQDWMTDEQLATLWRQITRTARPGARVIFRTAANERLLPGRVPHSILGEWTYDDARSRLLHARDRSSIYGAFHLYRKAGA